MLRWCSYCQSFQGEVPPFEQLDLTHGVCRNCWGQGLREEAMGIEARTARWDWVDSAARFGNELWTAGSNGDLRQAPLLVKKSVELGIQPLDLLVGYLAPALRKVGNLWEEGRFSVADEHRFTAFAEQLFSLLQLELTREKRSVFTRPRALLVNVDGNYHTLGLRVAAFWFQFHGFQVETIYPGIPGAEIVRRLEAGAIPDVVGLSISMLSQLSAARELIGRLECLGPARPQILLGGYAVKSGQVRASDLPGCRLVAHFEELSDRTPLEPAIAY